MKRIAGVGINDYSGIVARYASGKQIWKCPIYTCWSNMLRRCYDTRVQEKHPTYIDCTVAEEWLLFSNFRQWAITEYREGHELDKDILCRSENKHYSPSTCLFISKHLNRFLAERKLSNQQWPIGVTWNKKRKSFAVRCTNEDGKRVWLGWTKTASEGHILWQKYKLSIIQSLLTLQTGKCKLALHQIAGKLQSEIIGQCETLSLI